MVVYSLKRKWEIEMVIGINTMILARCGNINSRLDRIISIVASDKLSDTKIYTDEDVQRMELHPPT